MLLASSYPFWSVFWSMMVFFIWILWFWLLITIFADIFRRHDLSGFGKVAWLIFVIILPFLGVFVYIIVNNEGMQDRRIAGMAG
ncbi:MAG TPA: PLDc N-terminal domain-containing protein [Gaiellaceae bacterium]|nr:PLDc N-terminal domain-containing protein [Gaiellaceae bacterium]